MVLTLVTAASSATANAYADLVEAEAYVATMVWAENWVGKTDEQKKAALINAARMMDDIPWKGMKSTIDQSMAWPRTGNLLLSSRTLNFTTPSVDYLLDRDGYPVPSTVVPVRIKNASIQFAVDLLGDDRAADSGGLAPETMKIGSLDMGRMRRNPIPASVLEMVRDFLANAGGPRMVRS